MQQGRARKVLVEHLDADGLHRAPDALVVEEPLEIRLDGHVVATTMRTPGHDVELAVGFCHAEGLLDGVEPLRVRHRRDAEVDDPTGYNAVDVETGGLAPVPAPRLGTVSSACGLCGAESLDELRSRLRPLVGIRPPSLDVLVSIPERVRPHQELFAATGASHAAALVDARGEVRVLREDIGRHNAVDKVVGRLRLDGDLPAGESALFVSGRASFEMVQKAWAAGCAAVVAVSAPSALAVEAATVAGLTLLGFTRGGEANVYVRGSSTTAP